MKTFYLAGQSNFGNRGCEALVRSTVQLIGAQHPGSTFLTPSFDPHADGRQWSDHREAGIRFVGVNPFPSKLKWFGRAMRLMPAVKNFWLPIVQTPNDIASDVTASDALIMIGGDNITLDYGIPSLLWNTRFVEQALSDGIPVMLWAASIGPFSADPAIERYMVGFLNRLTSITVRESDTFEYLASIGVSANVTLVTDPAFVMSPEPFDIAPVLPEPGKAGLLGFNISPLIQKFRVGHEDELLDQVAAFIANTTQQLDFSVLLVPHVDPLDGSVENSDSAYMAKILERVAHIGQKVALAPATLNATQLKFLISHCRYFIGARTHSTIAALSTLVPTLSIAYSAKAKGINKDLFGHNDLVLESPDVSTTSLEKGLSKLIAEEEDIRTHLSNTIPSWRERAQGSVSELDRILK